MVHMRLFEDVDKIMKDSSLLKEGPMVGRSFLRTEIEDDGGEWRERWVRKDI